MRLFLIVVMAVYVFISAFAQNDYEPQAVGALFLNFEGVRNDSVNLRLCNMTTDTFYVFDSYLGGEQLNGYQAASESQFLHRYDNENKRFKLSFVPLLPYLSYNRSGLYLSSPDRVVKHMGVTYHFAELLPGAYFPIRISMQSFEESDYYYDIDMKNITIADKEIKFHKFARLRPKIVYVELAVYYSLNNICSGDDFYFNSWKFDRSIKKWIEVSIPIMLRNNWGMKISENRLLNESIGK